MSQNAQPLQNASMNGQSGKPLPAFLQKKGLLGGAKMGSSIVSPTDNVLSPCSAKLSGAKQKHFAKGKPMGLASQLSQLAVSGNSNNENKPKVDF